MVTVSKLYKQLIDQFPLRPIKTAEEKAEATKVMIELAKKGSTRTEDETDYLVVLSKIMADYESNMPEVQELQRRVNKITPRESLHFLMKENGLTQLQLAKELGIDQGNLSAFLNGHRKLSAATAFKLARYFGLALDSFIRT